MTDRTRPSFLDARTSLLRTRWGLRSSALSVKSGTSGESSDSVSRLISNHARHSRPAKRQVPAYWRWCSNRQGIEDHPATSTLGRRARFTT